MPNSMRRRQLFRVRSIRSPTQRNAAGFTLTELAITSCIVGMLCLGTVSAFTPLIDRAHVITLVADFHASITRARNEAVRRGRRVDLLPIVAGDWRSGWCVAIDANDNQRVDQGELVLHRGAATPSPDAEISARMTDSKRTYLAFDASGRPRTVASASVPQYGSVMFRLGQQRRKLVMGFLGRVRVCDPDRDGAAC